MAPRSKTSARPSGKRRSPSARSAQPSRSGRSAKRSGTQRPTARAPGPAGPSDRYKGFNGEVDAAQLDELLLQALETEIGGIEVYETAIRCAQDEELREEWSKYLEQTRNHERILGRVFEQRGLDADRESPGRKVVRHLGGALVQAMEMALEQGSPAAAQLVAAECVVLAETKDHANWELIGEAAKALGNDNFAVVLQEAHDEVEDEEDEHLYHTMGWSRELWLQTLGLPAVLPPPEEKRDVKTAIGAAKAKAGRKRMLVKAT